MIREATQSNSHIVPRFMGVKILESPEGKRKGFKIDNDPNFLKQKPQQDSPKEDNILCPDCEGNLGKLERKLANEVYYKFKYSEFDKEFVRINLPNGIIRVSGKKVDYVSFKLAAYGIFFKVAISKLPYFLDFRMTEEHKEVLRQILNRERTFEDIPLTVLTSENDQEFTRNYIYAHSDKQYLTHSVWANDYIFYLDFGSDTELSVAFDGITMKDEGLFKLGVVPNEVWDGLRRSLMMAKINKIKK